MNTDVRLVVADGPEAAAALERAAAEFARYERCLSRFDPASELSALNRTGGRPVAVSPLLFEALAAARSLLLETAGLYNPAVLPALEAAGYDRSFDRLQPAESGSDVTPGDARSGAVLRPPAEPYQLDGRSREVRLAPYVRLDLGGIGKGLAVDAAAEELAGQVSFLVDAGGDIRVGGTSPDDGPWGIAVQHPVDLDRDIAVLAVSDCAVATSSVGRRRWVQDGAVRHHLIDPRTGLSAASDVTAATVIAPRCAPAEVWAKAVVIAGAVEGFALLARNGIAGLVVDADRRLRVNEAMQTFLAESAA
jgi:thiamine biosynthesis lipoprotein